MPTLTQIRDGLKTRLDTIEGLRAHDTVPGQLQPPAAVVEPGDPVVQFDTANARGLDTWTFKIRVFVAFQSDKHGQDKLDSFLAPSGDSSVKAAVEGDRTLGGTVADCRVVEARSYDSYVYGNVTYLGVEFTVTVWAQGT